MCSSLSERELWSTSNSHPSATRFSSRPLLANMPAQPLNERVGFAVVAMSMLLALSPRPMAAQSDRWIEVAAGSTTTVFADRVSIRREGARVKVWTKWIFSDERKVEYLVDKTYRSQKSLDIYNCANRTSATLQAIYYAESDASGDVVDSSSWPESRVRFSELAPETVGESILEYVCRASLRRRR
jgi:hypothetical protein